MVNGAGRGRLGVVRGCPFATGKDRCEWQANGMAAEDDPGIRLRRWRHPDRTVRSVLGEECLVGKSPEGTVRPTTDEAPILAVVTTPALRSSTTSGQSALPSPASRSSRVGRLPCLLWTRRNWAIQANLYQDSVRWARGIVPVGVASAVRNVCTPDRRRPNRRAEPAAHPAAATTSGRRRRFGRRCRSKVRKPWAAETRVT